MVNKGMVRISCSLRLPAAAYARRYAPKARGFNIPSKRPALQQCQKLARRIQGVKSLCIPPQVVPSGISPILSFPRSAWERRQDAQRPHILPPLCKLSPSDS